MMLFDYPLIVAMAYLSGGILILSLTLAFFRVLRGPSNADRVVALDFITVLLIGFAAIAILIDGSSMYLDIALALAITGFLATIAFARLIEKRGEHQ